MKLGEGGMGDKTPLDVMLTVMRKKLEDEDHAGAVAVARLAAPYVHARAAVVRHWGELAGVPDDELDEWDGGGGSGGEAAAEAGAG